MPDEVEEIQPAGEGANTISGDLAPVEGAEGGESVDVSDTMAESSMVSGQEEAMGGMLMPGGAGASFIITKPRSNLFTLLLILSFLCIGLAIYLLAHELNNFYGVTFGGILSPPDKIAETTETER